MADINFLKVHIPKVPEITPFTPPRPQIDTSKFAAAGAAAAKAYETGELLNLQSRLSVLKLQTIQRSLSTDQFEEATLLVAKLAAMGELRQSDIWWCEKHGVPIP